MLADAHREASDAIVSVEILHDQITPAGVAVISESGRTPGCGTFDRLSSGRCFPGRDGLHDITIQSRRFRFDAAGITTGTSSGVWNAGHSLKPRGDSIAPDHRVSGLICPIAGKRRPHAQL